MSKRIHSLVLGLAVAIAACSPPASAPRPNVLFIVLDDLNTRLGAYGDPIARSPHIDRLAESGVRFANAHAQYPLCMPSRASFLSGRYPESLGVYRNGGPMGVGPNLPILLPESFMQQGYRTARSGKVFKADVDWGLPPGEAASDRLQVELADGERAAMLQRALDLENAERAHLGLAQLEFQTPDSRSVGRAIEWLEEASDLPFLLMVGLDGTHPPFRIEQRFLDLFSQAELESVVAPSQGGVVPEIAVADRQSELAFREPGSAEAEALDRLEIATYYASVSMVDEEVGLLVSALERLGLRDNTIIVLISDHGFHLGEHGGIWRKGTLFEEATRVPMILAGPTLSAGVVSEPVELVDLFPTLIELTGLTPPSGLQGLSLTSMMVDPAESRSRPAYSVVLRDGKRFGRTVRGSRYRYTEWDGVQLTELYDHLEDPGELVNLSATEGFERLREQQAAILHEAAGRASSGRE